MAALGAEADEGNRRRLLELCAGRCEKCGKPIDSSSLMVYRRPSGLIIVCPACRMVLEKEGLKIQGFFKEIPLPPKPEEYTLLNGLLLLSFVLPALFAVALNFELGFFYQMVIIWVHEAGHGFVCIFTGSVLCYLAGFLMEMLVTIVPAAICLSKKEAYIAAFVLLMCAGFSLQHNGEYMQSALNPSGTSFAGALAGRYNDMNPSSHDWSVIFADFGLLDDSYGIGTFISQFGYGLAVIFLATSLISLIPFIQENTKGRLTGLVGVGAVLSVIYFLISGSGEIQVITAAALSIPLVYERLKMVL